MEENRSFFTREYACESGVRHVPDAYCLEEGNCVDPRKDQYGLMKAADELGLSMPRRVVIRAKIGR